MDIYFLELKNIFGNIKMDNKRKIVEQFRTLIKYQETEKGQNWFFRVRAYKKAIKYIEKLEGELVSVDQIRGVKGIGKKIRAKVEEFLKKGKIEEAVKNSESLRLLKDNPKTKTLRLFSSVKGIGYKIAEKLWSLGMRTLEDLEKNKDKTFIFPGSKKPRKLLTSAQQLGIKYYEHFNRRIPRKNITILSTAIKAVIYSRFGFEDIEIKVVGSYRRKSKDSGDIDIIFTSSVVSLDEIVGLLESWGLVVDTLAHKKGAKPNTHSVYHGVTSCRGSNKFYQLDITSIPRENWGAAVLHSTGSADFNVKLRKKALKLNYKLNEKGLFSKITGKKLSIYTEEGVFQALGEDWVEPKDR